MMMRGSVSSSFLCHVIFVNDFPVLFPASPPGYSKFRATCLLKRTAPATPCRWEKKVVQLMKMMSVRIIPPRRKLTRKSSKSCVPTFFPPIFVSLLWGLCLLSLCKSSIAANVSVFQSQLYAVKNLAVKQKLCLARPKCRKKDFFLRRPPSP